MHGLLTISTPFSVNETCEKLLTVFDSNGITVYSRIDHSRNALEQGLFLRSTQVIIFGNPILGTPIIHENQTAAIDLPLKLLIWEDMLGKVWITCNDIMWLAKRHHLGKKSKHVCLAIGDKLATLIHKAIM